MIFPGTMLLIRTCAKCHEECVAWISFERTVGGDLALCERCLVQALGLGSHPWTSHVEACMAKAQEQRTAKKESWWGRICSVLG